VFGIDGRWLWLQDRFIAVREALARIEDHAREA
jgi:hypothetical protein